MNREIRERRYELYTKFNGLKKAQFASDSKHDNNKKRDELFNRFNFFNNMIKANEKNKKRRNNNDKNIL